MALSNAQLLMLDNLIYTDFCENDKNVRTIIKDMKAYLSSGNKIDACDMTTDEWWKLVRIIEQDENLLEYTVQNYVSDEKGMRVACFVDDVVNPQDINVAFRGTSTDYEWHDNGEGGYLTDTEEQLRAAKYINDLPDYYGDNLTVTGHSKGGNKAQYVTIVTKRIAKCVSVDGQGFSEEFTRKYKSEIEKKANQIISISASNDIVNALLYPIAGTQIYIKTEDQGGLLDYHKPNILLDNNGNLREETIQNELVKMLNEYTKYVVSTMDEPEKSITIDGLIAFLEKGENKEHLIQSIWGAMNGVSHLDDFVFNYIGENYGFPLEYLATCLGAIWCPALYLDDFFNSNKEIVDAALSRMKNHAHEIEKKLQEYGNKAKDLSNKFVAAVERVSNNVNEYLRNAINYGYRTAGDNTLIRVDTAKLRSYSYRLRSVNDRLSKLDSRLDSLYFKVGILDLFRLIHADFKVGYNSNIANCAKYLEETANDFDSTERNVASLFY